MHQDWTTEHWELESVYMHMSEAQLRLGTHGLPHCHRVAQMALWVEMVLVVQLAGWVGLVEENLHLQCVCGVWAVPLWQGRQLSIWFSRSIARCLIIPAYTFLHAQNPISRFCSPPTAAQGLVIRYCVPPIVVIEYGAKEQIEWLKSNEENPKQENDKCNEIKKCSKQDHVMAERGSIEKISLYSYLCQSKSKELFSNQRNRIYIYIK